jgi:hypothetical protein
MTVTQHPELTQEELQKRARVRELRDQIGMLAHRRRAIKSCYSLPHGQEQHLYELTRLRRLFGIPSYGWNQHCQPSRHDYKAELTALHIELATLRGKVHGPVVHA